MVYCGYEKLLQEKSGGGGGWGFGNLIASILPKRKGEIHLPKDRKKKVRTCKKSNWVFKCVGISSFHTTQRHANIAWGEKIMDFKLT